MSNTVKGELSPHKCPDCEIPLLFYDKMFISRGSYMPWHVCKNCHKIWENPYGRIFCDRIEFNPFRCSGVSSRGAQVFKEQMEKQGRVGLAEYLLNRWKKKEWRERMKMDRFEEQIKRSEMLSNMICENLERIGKKIKQTQCALSILANEKDCHKVLDGGVLYWRDSRLYFSNEKDLDRPLIECPWEIRVRTEFHLNLFLEKVLDRVEKERENESKS